jgi:hypothetical protein
MSTQPKTFLTPEQYLEVERRAETSYRHGQIVTSMLFELAHKLRGRKCQPVGGDVRVRVSD